MNCDFRNNLHIRLKLIEPRSLAYQKDIITMIPEIDTDPERETPNEWTTVERRS